MRTIRFDASDDRVFVHAAGPDEWAISGAFAFAGADGSSLTGKARQAFASGFLSLESYGNATFVTVAEIGENTVEALVGGLARHLVDHYGAPDRDAARAAAREEIGFILDLCVDAPLNTVFAVTRSFDETGNIREAFRAVAAPGEKLHTRIWDTVEE